MSPVIVPATAETIRAFFGEKSLPSMKAFVAMMDGEPIAVFGLHYIDGAMVLFSYIKPEARSFRKSIVKGAKKVMDMAKRLNVPVYATADESVSQSASFLEWLGFTHYSNGVYLWHG